MSVNRALEHVLVLPEDDANRQIATGFQLNLDWSFQRRIQVLPPAGGWIRVLETFESDHIADMDRYKNRIIILLIDFDDNLARLSQIRARIPGRMEDRVYVLGALNEPETLRRAGLGSYEEIGAKIVDDCRQGTNAIWAHVMLHHNAEELSRLQPRIQGILF